MTRAPRRPKAPRFSIAARYGLPEGAPWTAVPTELLLLAADLGLPASETLVLLAALTFWRPEAGNSFPVSVRDLAPLAGLDPSGVHRALASLSDQGLLGNFPEPGKTRTIDVTALLAQVQFHARFHRPATPGENVPLLLRQRNTAVAPVQHQLLRQDNSTVAKEGGNCCAAEPASGHTESEKDSRVRARARDDVNVAARTPPRSGPETPAAPAAENGHATTPPHPLEEIRRRLTAGGRAPHTPGPFADQGTVAARKAAIDRDLGLAPPGDAP